MRIYNPWGKNFSVKQVRALAAKKIQMVGLNTNGKIIIRIDDSLTTQEMTKEELVTLAK